MEPHPRFEPRCMDREASFLSLYTKCTTTTLSAVLPYELWSYCCRLCIAAPHFVRIRHVALGCKQASVSVQQQDKSLQIYNLTCAIEITTCYAETLFTTFAILPILLLLHITAATTATTAVPLLFVLVLLVLVGVPEASQHHSTSPLHALHLHSKSI
jgi:hypothetical protein